MCYNPQDFNQEATSNTALNHGSLYTPDEHHSVDHQLKTSASWWQLNQALHDQQAKPFKKPDDGCFYGTESKEGAKPDPLDSRDPGRLGVQWGFEGLQA